MSINGNQNCKTRIDFHLFSKLFKIVASSSDRFLEIEDCEECCGHGKQEKYQKRTCPLCEGEGWFEDSKGLIMVCDLCHGFKSLNEPFFTDCPKCDSKGKKVYLMQKFLVEAPCDDCIGTGIRYSKCNECDGKGHSFQKLSVTNWNSTNEAKKNDNLTWSGLFIGNGRK
jgi:DnaJ-class molecular chaperone